MKPAKALLLAFGLLAFATVATLASVQWDEYRRNSESLRRLQQAVAELESRPRDEWDAEHVQSLSWRKADLEFFEKEAVPSDFYLLVALVAILVAGAACTAIALFLAFLARRQKSV